MNEEGERIRGDDQNRTEASINKFETHTRQISTQIANIT